MSADKIKFKVDKGIAIPPKGNSSPLLAAMKTMEVGDSMELPKTSYNNVMNFKLRLKFKVAIRKTGADKFRFWRTE